MKNTHIFFGGLLLAFSLFFTSCTDDSLASIEDLTAGNETASVRTDDVIPKLYSRWKSGNASFECDQAGSSCAYSWKIDANAPDGTYHTNTDAYDNTPTDVDANITISNSDNYTFDWSSDYQVCSVIVKAGRDALVYSYPEGSCGATGISAPVNPKNGKVYEISHVTFCFGEATCDAGEEEDEVIIISTPIRY